MQISQALGVDFICFECPLSDIAAPDDHMSDTFCRLANTESFSLSRQHVQLSIFSLEGHTI